MNVHFSQFKSGNFCNREVRAHCRKTGVEFLKYFKTLWDSKELCEYLRLYANLSTTIYFEATKLESTYGKPVIKSNSLLPLLKLQWACKFFANWGIPTVERASSLLPESLEFLVFRPEPAQIAADDELYEESLLLPADLVGIEHHKWTQSHATIVCHQLANDRRSKCLRHRQKWKFNGSYL